MSRHRFTMEELEQWSDEFIIQLLVNERKNDIVPYTPLSERLAKISARLDHCDLQDKNELKKSKDQIIQFTWINSMLTDIINLKRENKITYQQCTSLFNECMLTCFGEQNPDVFSKRLALFMKKLNTKPTFFVSS